jgi:RNA polymerase sigma-70 factor (ECF subfamily)
VEHLVTEILELLDTAGRDLFRLLYRVTSREDVAEDLMQELFLRLRASREFHAARDRLAYARRTALNLAFDWRRKQRSAEVGGLLEEELADEARSPLRDLVIREDTERVLEAMSRLPSRDRELLTLRYIQQQPVDTIAGQYGKTAHQVRALCHKALRRLRGLLPASMFSS